VLRCLKDRSCAPVFGATWVDGFHTSAGPVPRASHLCAPLPGAPRSAMLRPMTPADAVPGVRALATYRIAWLRRDVVAGAVLSTLLVPQ